MTLICNKKNENKNEENQFDHTEKMKYYTTLVMFVADKTSQ